MPDARLRTDLWISAGLRRCNADGMAAYVVRRGEAESGMVLMKLHLIGQGFRVLSLSRNLAGKLAWMPGLDGATVAEADADAYLARQTGRDPDLWVVEVESRKGEHPFDPGLL
jgi:hypothetical protein